MSPSPHVVLAVTLLLSLGLGLAVSGQVLSTYNPRQYARQTRVNDKMVFRWTIAGTGNLSRLDFAIEALTTTGWIGIGVGLPGAAMPGADMGIAFINPAAKRLTFGDYYATDFSQPILDPCGDNTWKATGYLRNATATVVVGSRLLAAHDAVFDRSIVQPNLAAGDDPLTMLLFAFGPSQAFTGGHVSAVHRLLPLFAASPDRLAPLADLRQAFVGMKSHRLSTTTTEYTFSPCYSAASLGFNVSSSSVSVFAASFSMKLTTEHYVHHMLLKGYFGSDHCNGHEVDLFETASDPEGGAFIFPAGVAFNLSLYSGFKTQMHYDNRHGHAGVRDSSGVVIHWRTTPPTHVAGLLQVGDPVVRLSPNQLPHGKSRHVFECGSGCTAGFPRDITIFSRGHHMHEYGRRMTSLVLAPNGTVKHAETSDYYDFHRQRLVLMRPIRVTRGDILITECIYDTAASRTPVAWGIQSANEMCIDFLYYYPATPAIHPHFCGINACGRFNHTGPLTALAHTFGVRQRTTCPVAPPTKAPPVGPTTRLPSKAPAGATAAPPSHAPSHPVFTGAPGCVRFTANYNAECGAGFASLSNCGACVQSMAGGFMRFDDCMNPVGPTMARGCNSSCVGCKFTSRIKWGTCAKHVPEIPFIFLQLDMQASCVAALPPPEPVGPPQPVHYLGFEAGSNCGSLPTYNFTRRAATCFDNVTRFQCINNTVVNTWHSSPTCDLYSMYSKKVNLPPQNVCDPVHHLIHSCSPLPLFNPANKSAATAVVFFRQYRSSTCKEEQASGMFAVGGCFQSKRFYCVNKVPRIATFSDAKCSVFLKNETLANRACQPTLRMAFDCVTRF